LLRGSELFPPGRDDLNYVVESTYQVVSPQLTSPRRQLRIFAIGRAVAENDARGAGALPWSGVPASPRFAPPKPGFAPRKRAGTEEVPSVPCSFMCPAQRQKSKKKKRF